MKEKVKVGWVGVGRRAHGMLKNIFSVMEDVEITAICDIDEAGLERGRAIMQENNLPGPILTKNYDDILNNPDIDAIIIMTPWMGRVDLAIKAMRAGKYVGIEVGSAYDLQECFNLVETYEETGVPVMMLENCCYGRREMMALNIAEQGLFGEIVHCNGAYAHHLEDEELFKEMVVEPKGDKVTHYRLNDYMLRNCDQYATHEFGPISKVLKLNRGNKLLTISSMASKSRGLKQYAKDKFGPDNYYAQVDYKQGDIVSSNLLCAGGETVHLTLDTTLPRSYYSREFTVRGTKGLCAEERHSIYLDFMEGGPQNMENEEEMFKTYDHPLHKEYVELGEKAGHGGMDWLVGRAFIEAVKNGTNTPIDAYDTALWLSIGPLSEASINKGGAPVEVPDFTKGKWINREPITEGKYCLDKVCEDKNTKIY